MGRKATKMIEIVNGGTNHVDEETDSTTSCQFDYDYYNRTTSRGLCCVSPQ
jgi:hypothetical protein